MSSPELNLKEVREAASRMRKTVLRLALNGGMTGVHVGPALSLVEIMACLFKGVMRKSEGNDREFWDKFALSKGHGALCYYIALQEAGIIDMETLNTYEKNGGDLPGQPVKNKALGIEFASGTLGMGLAFGAGLAKGAKMKGEDRKIFVVIGDGESNEGSIWESAMYARHACLDNLVAIVDRNGMQSDGKTKDVLDLDHEAIWRSMGWSVTVCGGHDVTALDAALRESHVGLPRVIIANTVKGKGVSFMESNNEWHHHRLTKEQFDAAMLELGGC